MSDKKYIFQRKKISFTNRLFEKGLNAAAYILFSLKESGELFLRDLPSCYPGLKIVKDFFDAAENKKEFKKRDFFSAMKGLQKQGLVRKDLKRKIYFLTDRGKEMVDFIEDRYSVLNEKWDGKIRIVIFDIPESKKHYREWFRGELLLLDFKELQKSVYAGKYSLPQGLFEEIFNFGLDKFIFVFTVGEVDKKDFILKFLEK